ncbi:EAL domain-containing protein [Vibrio alfacsensis]|uniref:EAL domain-containing protein n=1 Tax=Vibrio alfacsensis TaxID=1074311 RepID=UPI004068032F
MNILIVEDDLLQATNLKILLNRLLDTQISIVHSGLKVKEICAKQSIDLMFCDIDLPDLNGVDLLSTLPKEDRPKGVVILSAMNQDVVDITYSMCLSADYFFAKGITKPISSEQLSTILVDFEKQTKQTKVTDTKALLGTEDIERAFTEGWFVNHYQPQYKVSNDELIGVEALVRCQHPELGLLTPASFLSQLNQSHHQDRLFWVVLENALKDMTEFPSAMELSVNMNQKSLNVPMSQRLLELCKQYRFAPEQLTLELTEDDVYDSGVVSLANLANLRLKGVGLAIDDFGTGYSSLSQLSILPFTELKIDQQFIGNALLNFKSQQLTVSSLQLAKSLGLKSVAEGVEDRETLAYLRQIGVDFYQGFVASKPVPIDTLKTLI